LTYGQYIKAINAVKKSTEEIRETTNSKSGIQYPSDICFDQLYYLEEIGFSWYTYQIKDSFHEELSHRRIGRPSRSTLQLSSLSLSSSSNSGTISSRKSISNSTPNTPVKSTVANEGARYVTDLEEALRLQKCHGQIPFFYPRSISSLMPTLRSYHEAIKFGALLSMKMLPEDTSTQSTTASTALTAGGSFSSISSEPIIVRKAKSY
jgi:hypothetical protein